MDRNRRLGLQNACADRDKVFTAEVVLELLDALDAAEKRADDLEERVLSAEVNMPSETAEF